MAPWLTWTIAIVLTPMALLVVMFVIGALDEWGEQIATALLGLVVVAVIVALVHEGVVAVFR